MVLSDALERGEILFMPRCPVALPSEDSLRLLRDELPVRLGRKNISWYPSGKLRGLDGDEQLRDKGRVHPRGALLRGAQAPRDCDAPIDGRVRRGDDELSADTGEEPRARSTRKQRAHSRLDAGAYGATHGDRILRFFTNLNETEDRVWVSLGTFPELFSEHGTRAGIPQARELRPGVIDRLRCSISRAARRLGVDAARALESSPYDRVMRRFHNFMKDSDELQARTEGRTVFRFPPYSSWAVFTDTRSHACIEGQHALVSTFLVRLDRCHLRHLAPYDVLAGGAAP